MIRFLIPLCLLVSSPAFACGGLFCQQPQLPVDQSSEDILFTVDEEAGIVRAEIRISYEGDAAGFSWILPVPSMPEVRVGRDAVFRALRSVTDVRFDVDTQFSNCTATVEGGGGGGGAGSALVDFGVQVTAGSTGPYDYVILSAHDAETLVEWLGDNEYFVPPNSVPLMDHYLAQDMLFIAVKLTAGAGTNDIAPIILEYESEEPCVPLVLTSIAARPNMPIRVWVAGPGAAIPANWFQVEPNWARLNWEAPSRDGSSNGQLSYSTLIEGAINRAEGHGFHTEYRNSTAEAASLLLDWGSDVNQLKSARTAADLVRILIRLPATTALSSCWGCDAIDLGLVRVLQEALPNAPPMIDRDTGQTLIPLVMDGHDLDRFLGQRHDLHYAIEILDDRIFLPLRQTGKALSQRQTLTRLVTIVSPQEMTRDPIFDFRPDQPDVSPIREATVYWGCEAGQRVVQLPDGSVFQVPPNGTTQPWQQTEPLAREVYLESPDRLSFRVKAEDRAWADDQLGMLKAAAIIDALEEAAPYAPQQHAKIPVEFTGAGSVEGQGCRSSQAPMGPAPLVVFAGLAFAIARRCTSAP